MELKLRIGYAELFELVRQLPASQIFQLKSELASKVLPERKAMEKAAFRALLLKGPVISEEQYQQFLQTRNWMSQWRTSH
jgi:hypothetical protein